MRPKVAYEVGINYVFLRLLTDFRWLQSPLNKITERKENEPDLPRA